VLKIEKSAKIAILLIISFITGIIGATLGIYFSSAMRVVSGEWMFGLVGFFIPILIYFDIV
jgi:hypothetical protein